MRCCVPGCKSNSKQNKKAQGITFHVFPSEQTLRSCWVKALNIDNWTPRDHSAVCSKHFQIDDMYETKSGMRKIRVGAVPMLLKGRTNCGYQEMVPLLACRICLATETKMYAMKEYNLDEAYASVTGLSLSPEDKLPQMLCVECAQRIQNHVKFVRKSHAANSIMLELVRKHDVLTLEAVKSINRDKKLLSSPLSLKLYNSCHYDLQIEYDDVTDVNTSSNDHNHSLLQNDIVSNFDIKVESSNNEVFISENEDFNQTDDMKDDLAVHKENIIVNDENGGYIDNENQNDDTNEAMDVDFSISPKDGEEFSTDDSMPLELSRTKKKVKTKKKEEKIKTTRKRQLKKEQSEPKIDRRRKPFLSDELNETLFTITDLTFEEQVAEIQKRQESANYKNSVYKCTECFKGFLDEDAYNGHMSRHTHECGDHQCDICKTYFRHSHALRKHITAHHTQRFSCNQCPYVTTHRQTARLHERWHKGTKYQCPHCQDEFVKFTTYMGHIRIKHPSDFVCALCGYSFVSQKGIELHKKLKHRVDTLEIPEDGPLCEPCNVRFVSSDALRQHLRVSARHSGGDLDSREANKPRKGRKSKEAKERERRLRDKNDKDMDDRPLYPSQMRKAEGPIPCEQCGLQLEDSRAYHGHFRRVHPDKNRTNYPSMKSPCMCEVCGRMFQSYALLKDHRWTHTGERPFGCDSCGKRFRMRQRLVAHRRVHSLEKASYLCNLCGKHFSTHSNRQRHMFIHTGLKPFKCEMCGKCFKHASEKRAHITYVHLKKPWPKRSRGKRRSERQGSVPPQPMPGASEIALPQQQVWPCEKLDLPPSIDKPVYYNLKI